MAKTLSVVVGRFQLPYLHTGHRNVLIKASAQGDAVLVGVGSANKSISRTNPLPVDYRKGLVQRMLAEMNITPFTIVALDDTKSNDLWSERLDNIINAACVVHECQDVIMWTDNQGFAPHYTGQYTQQIQLVPSTPDWRATDLRAVIGRNAKTTTEWANGVVWATQQGFPQVIPTVDIACEKPNGELLVGRKLHETQWRLPGGFVDIADHNFLAAAKRELGEEVGQIETSDWKCVNSFPINDWRMDGKTQKIITTLFSCYYIFGSPIASDDLAEIKWITKITPQDVVSEHQEMFDYLKRF